MTNLRLPFRSVLGVDGSNLLHRSHHAYPFLTSEDGIPTGAIYGTINMLERYINLLQPLYVVVALDERRECFRNDLYPEYKQNRSKRDENLQSQFRLFAEFCELAGIQCLNEDEYEADDLLGSLAHTSLSKGYEPFILSGDRDIFQLVNEDIKSIYVSAKDGGLTMFDENAVKEKYGGLTPSQLIDLKAIQGDTSDNVPGIRGIGEKTGIKLINKYGSIDGLYENVEELKGKQKEKVIADKDNAYISKELVTIKCDIDIDFNEGNVYSFDNDKLQEFYNRLSIKRD